MGEREVQASVESKILEAFDRSGNEEKVHVKNMEGRNEDKWDKEKHDCEEYSASNPTLLWDLNPTWNEIQTPEMRFKPTVKWD